MYEIYMATGFLSFFSLKSNPTSPEGARMGPIGTLHVSGGNPHTQWWYDSTADDNDCSLMVGGCLHALWDGQTGRPTLPVQMAYEKSVWCKYKSPMLPSLPPSPTSPSCCHPPFITRPPAHVRQGQEFRQQEERTLSQCMEAKGELLFL